VAGQRGAHPVADPALQHADVRARRTTGEGDEGERAHALIVQRHRVTASVAVLRWHRAET